MEPLPNPPEESGPQPDNEPAVPHAPGQVFAPKQAGPSPIEPPREPVMPPPPQIQPDTVESRPTAVINPAASNYVYVNGHTIEPDGPATSFMSRLKTKAVVLPVVAVIVILGGSAAAYFGYYMPNQPDNIWKTALNRTGQGFDKLSQYAVTQFKTPNGGLKLKGSFKTTGLLAADGSFSGSNDKDNGEYTGSLSTSGAKVDIDVRLIKSATSTPDIYFKIDGIQGLGDLVGGFAGPQYATAINGLNGKWYFIDHSLFDQFSSGTGNGLQVTSDDVKSVLNAVNQANQQNIFTTDPSKMAFTDRKNVGKEKQDGRNVYHFVAGINKDNLKKYVNNLCNNLKNSNLKKYFNGDSQQVNDALGCNTASSSIDKFDSSRTADVWVDMHTKLIHRIRITDTKNKNNHFDISQDYQGGSRYPFALNFHSQDQGLTSDSAVNLTLDTTAKTLNLAASTKDSGSDNFAGNLNLEVSPNNAKVNVQKPAGAETIIQLLNDLGLPGIISDGVNSQAADTERQTDISALQAQAEVYYADNGYYPSLAQFNDPAWRSANMKGLDSQALKDPAGTSTTLVAKPTPGAYAYQATPAGCDNVKVKCTDYTLTASLDDGSTYSKQSLNGPGSGATIE